jgi:elongation factor P hydroxylase
MTLATTQQSEPDAQDLIHIFNDCFKESLNTILEGNGQEPIYLPASSDNSHHRIVFTQDYFSSALHEIAHWCVAGESRRQKVDYGYWYLPDGRNAQQQAAFESVEVKPQALEYAFSLACNIPFRVSVDNLSGEETCSKGFEKAVREQLRRLIMNGFNQRTRDFLNALHAFYQTPELSIDATM